MKRIKITVLLILLCVLAGCSPKDTSLRAYCTESQQEFLDQSLEELPVALTYHHNDNILGRYETTDEEIISEILQALRETTIVSKAFSGSTDSRILEFETADGYIHHTPGSANDSFHTPHLRRHHSQSDCKGRISHSHTHRTGTGLPDRPSCILHFPGKDMSSDHSFPDNPAPLFLQP